VAPRLDFHTHTTASDGTLAPGALVRKAAEHGVSVLAVTDHDSTEGLAEAGEEAARHGITLVPGVEINCDIERADGRRAEVHVLGYFVDVADAVFQAFLAERRRERVRRVEAMCERLAALGMPVPVSEVFARAGAGAAGRPHVAQAMVDRGYVRSIREAFDRYLGASGPVRAPRFDLPPAEAVAVIRRARGVPVLAHPGLIGDDGVIPPLIEAGLLGIEAYYFEHSPAQTAAYLALCRQHGLVATGGSDYHGPRNGRSAQPGTPLVPESAWAELQAMAARVAAR
jgi:predicted metal-dependent phosphoesterase TrpH